MSEDYKILATLSNNLQAREVLHTVVRRRAVRLDQLVTEGVTHGDALAALNVLKGAHLVKETPAPIDDLKTYFVTATGLEMDRKVRM